MFFILFLPSTACAHDGSEFEQYYFWFLLVVVFWAIVISTFSMLFAYSLFKEAMRKNRSNNYLLENDEESQTVQVGKAKKRFYNEKQGTTIDVNMPTQPRE